jgi:hypothetical protein
VIENKFKTSILSGIRQVAAQQEVVANFSGTLSLL